MSCSVCAGYSSYDCPCCGGVSAVACPDCGGLGHRGFYAFDIIDRMAVKVEEAAYDALPDSEDMAEHLGWRYCKMETEKCPTCNGEGLL